MSDRSDFMGMKVEGSYGGWYRREKQEPIENLYPLFQAAFDKGVTAVMWEQYIPGFNDGEPCEFSVHTAKVTSNPVVAAAWLDNDEPDMDEAYPGQDFYYDEYDYEISNYSSHPDNLTSEHDVPVDSVKFEDALRGVFDYNTKIVVTPNRVVQFEWDCGY